VTPHPRPPEVHRSGRRVYCVLVRNQRIKRRDIIHNLLGGQARCCAFTPARPPLQHVCRRGCRRSGSADRAAANP
jgi:hypothetical protein